MKIIYIKPLPYLSNEEFCPAIDNNKSIYADASPHFSIANKLILVDFFYENLE